MTPWTWLVVSPVTRPKPSSTLPPAFLTAPATRCSSTIFFILLARLLIALLATLARFLRLLAGLLLVPALLTTLLAALTTLLSALVRIVH